MHNIEFDPGNHIYKVDGIVKDNVTKILESEGFSDFSGIKPDVLANAKERGTDVHAIAHYLLENRLDKSTVDESYLGYLNAIEAFLCDYDIEIVEIEQIVYSETWDFVGTLDLIFKYKNKLILLDWKTLSIMTKAVDIQLSGYKIASKHKIKEMWAVQLKNNGKYNISVCKDKKHIFLNAVQNYKWKKENLR